MKLPAVRDDRHGFICDIYHKRAERFCGVMENRIITADIFFDLTNIFSPVIDEDIRLFAE